MRNRTLVVVAIALVVVAILVLPAIASAANGVGSAPPGLHKAPAIEKAPVHVVCIRCHADPGFVGCMGPGCH